MGRVQGVAATSGKGLQEIVEISGAAGWREGSEIAGRCMRRLRVTLPLRRAASTYPGLPFTICLTDCILFTFTTLITFCLTILQSLYSHCIVEVVLYILLSLLESLCLS